MSKRIYLIRHGQSQGNAEGRVQGWLDSPLNERGRQQAQCLAHKLAATEATFHAIFASPLKRAAETAEFIARHLENCPLNFDNNLREYNMGPLTGLTLAEIEKKFPARYRAFERNESLAHLPGEEGERAFLERVHRGMEKVVAQVPSGQAAVVVSHAGTLNACLKNWLGITGNNRRPFGFANASITMVEINATNRRLIHLNDICHLAGLSSYEGVSE